MGVRIWGAVLAAGMVVLGPGGPATADPVGAVRLDLPAPGGGHRVGGTSLHLVDPARVDPLAPSTRARELMVRLWYPAGRSGRAPLAGYLPPIQAGLLTGQLNALLGTNFPAELLTFPTHSRSDAPAAYGRHPVLLFSPGSGTNAAFYTAIFEELATRGYVVAAIDHTFDAPVVEFPGGRVEFQNPDARPESPVVLALRVADIRFVLDQLFALAAGHNPDAEHRVLPRGLGRALDLTRIGAFGHSLGGIAVVGAIETDPRIDTGIALDGGPLGAASLDRPFLMFGNPTHRRDTDPDWANFFDRLRGPRLHLVVDGPGHYDLSDITIFKHTVDLGTIFLIGPIDGDRALTIERRYLTAWLNQTLRAHPSPLLRGESPQFSEVDFQG